MKTLKFLASFVAIVLLSFLLTQALAFADDAPPGVNYDFSEDEEDDDDPPTLGGTQEDDEEDEDDDDEDLGAGAGEDEDEDEDEDEGDGTPPPPPPPSTPDPKVKKDLSKTGPETYVFLLVGLTLSLVVNRKLATKKNRN